MRHIGFASISFFTGCQTSKKSSSSASPQILESSQPTKYNLLCNKQKTGVSCTLNLLYRGSSSKLRFHLKCFMDLLKGF